MKRLVVMSVFALISPLALAMAGHQHDGDPLLATVTVDRLEVGRSGGEMVQNWDMALAVGRDINKVQLRSEGARHGGDTGDVEWHLQWRHAIAPYWDLLAGARYDLSPHGDRQWLAVGLTGLAPHFVETDLALYLGEGGQSALRLAFERELLVSQDWALMPEVELDFHGANDPVAATGSGLSTLEAGLRLVYRRRPDWSPYVGVSWEKAFGDTAAFRRQRGEDASDIHWQLGVRFWY